MTHGRLAVDQSADVRRGQEADLVQEVAVLPEHISDLQQTKTKQGLSRKHTEKHTSKETPSHFIGSVRLKFRQHVVQLHHSHLL